MANIGDLFYGVLGTAPKFGLREGIEFAPVFTSSKQRRKRKFTDVFVQVVKKARWTCKICFFFFSFTYWHGRTGRGDAPQILGSKRNLAKSVFKASTQILEHEIVGPEQGFQSCFADGLNQSLVSSVVQANHRINVYYASIDKVLSELELRFSGNDQEILCAFGNICHSEI